MTNLNKSFFSHLLGILLLAGSLFFFKYEKSPPKKIENKLVNQKKIQTNEGFRRAPKHKKYSLSLNAGYRWIEFDNSQKVQKK